MTDMLADGTTKVQWVPSVASITAPTTTEINAGISLESVITPDGLDIPTTTATVDTSSLASTQNSQGVGRREFGPIVLTIKRQSNVLSGDAIRAQTLYRSSGYIVVRKGPASTVAFAAGQEVAVYPVGAGQQADVQVAPNELHKYTVQLFVTSDAAPNAVVA